VFFYKNLAGSCRQYEIINRRKVGRRENYARGGILHGYIKIIIFTSLYLMAPFFQVV
jgi:hypothetical protein